MNFIESLMNILNKLPANIKSEGMIMIITAGIALLAFIILLIVVIIKKPRFIKTAQKTTRYLKGSDVSQLNSYMKELPKTQLNSWKNYLKAKKGLPSSAFHIDACVNTPYRASAAVTAPIVMALMTILTTLLAGILAIAVNDYMIIGAILIQRILMVIMVAFVGALLTLILYLVSRSTYKKYVRVHENFCAAIDKAVTGNVQADNDSQHQEYVQQEYIQHAEEAPVMMHNEDEPVTVVQNNYYANENIQEMRNEESRIDEEIRQAEEKVNAVEAQVQEARAQAQARAEKIEAAKQAQAAAQAQAAQAQERQAAQEKQAAVQAAQERQAAQAAQEKQAAAQAQAAQERQAAAAQAQAQAYAQAQAAAQASKSEDLVGRIDRMIAENATQPQMREVAMLLQQERQKPENKSPEQTRRLNDALSRLLKAMATAPKA